MKRSLRRLFAGAGLLGLLLTCLSALSDESPNGELSSAAAPDSGDRSGALSSGGTKEPDARDARSARPPIGKDLSGALERSLPDSEGRTSKLSGRKGKNATVVVFISTECPISNGYLPTIERMASELAPRDVAFALVHSNDGQSLKDLAAHRKEFAISSPVLKDAGGELASQLGAARCPEAVVLDGANRLAYRGRIDDRYSRRGGASGKITRHDLAVAIEAVLANRKPEVAETEVVGCPIVARDRAKSDSSRDAAASVTWNHQIAPLLQRHCQRCHHAGGVGPFSLTTYDQAVAWADDLQTFTADRTMPPWLPAEGFGDFHNRRSLSQAEIDLIADWVNADCPRGEGTEPPPLEFTRSWTLGTPDLVLEPSQEFRLEADGSDVYRCFVLPTNLTEDRFVKAMEVLPGNPRVVHHVIAFLDTTGQSEKLDARDPAEGYSTSAGFPGFLPSGGLGGWAPGNQPRRLPDGMGKPLPAGARVVMQVHYHKTGKEEVDRTKLGIYFSKEKITRAVRTLPVMPFGGPLSGMRIPPGDAHYEVKASITLPRDLMLITVTPHMHLIGQEMKLTATRPEGDIEPLLWVKQWDFNWQESYQYREPVSLSAGTRLELVAHFDNSAENPSNPSSPPKEVRWGEQTTDEMCIAFLEVVPREEARSPDDLKIQRPGEMLQDALAEKLKQKLRERFRRSPESSPRD